ncbi:MAG: flagellar motor switch protein FliM [Clostridiales bacterium]|jgi:flagellar motor switch protein FliM|nr:flagellar motor switch protein FliM [Clostridiales bacterium]
MGDILSQSEIDNLLNALSQGGASNIELAEREGRQEAKSYNFKTPSKFNKEHLRTLEIIFENYARMVSSFLSAYLRTTIQIEVADASQTAYKEFSNSLLNPVILAIINPHPLKGSIILEIGSAIGYSIIDRILGGPGIELKKIRDFSEIEKVLLERVITQMLNYLKEPWENVIELRPRLEKVETNSQFAQIVEPSEIVALVTLSIKIGASEGFMNFCIPNLVVDPIMDRLNTKYWFVTPAESEQNAYQEKIEVRLAAADLPVAVIIGKASITVSDFLQLQAGDVIPLDSSVNSDLRVMVGDLLRFFGKPGLSRGKNAVQITSLVKKEEPLS